MLEKYCKIGQPIMTANKAAEIYYNRADILDKGIFMINKISSNKYMFSHVDDYKNGKVNATGRQCIFLNSEDECMLGDAKPDTCSGEKNIMPSLTKDILNIGFDKKGLKKRMLRFKEDLILYLAISYINRAVDKSTNGMLEDIFSIAYTYKLVLTDKTTINSIRYPKLTALKPEYDVVAKIYNHINRNMLVLDHSYMTILVKKLNSFINGGNFKTCDVELTDVEKTSVYLLSIFRLYITEYKLKSKEFTGIVEGVKTFKFLKDINDELGGNTNGKMFSREKIQCILDNTTQMYKIIMKNE